MPSVFVLCKLHCMTCFCAFLFQSVQALLRPTGPPRLQTREWKDGLLSTTFRDMANNKTNRHQWIVLDGDIDAEWVESCNTVMVGAAVAGGETGHRAVPLLGRTENCLLSTNQHALTRARPASAVNPTSIVSCHALCACRTTTRC